MSADIHNLYYWTNKTEVRRGLGMQHAWERRNVYKVLVWNWKVRDNIEKLGVSWRIVLKHALYGDARKEGRKKGRKEGRKDVNWYRTPGKGACKSKHISIIFRFLKIWAPKTQNCSKYRVKNSKQNMYLSCFLVCSQLAVYGYSRYRGKRPTSQYAKCPSLGYAAVQKFWIYYR
jgi:hypothetical protein